MIDAWLRLSARSQALWLFGASALIALAGLLFFEGAIVDGTGRTWVAARWLMAPYNIIGTQIWGDGNYILPALAIALGGDLFYSVRVLYALIGAATIPVLFFLARDVRGHEAAVWAGMLFALNPYRLVNSLEGATAEVPVHLPRVPRTLAGSTTESPGVPRRGVTRGSVLHRRSVVPIRGGLLGRAVGSPDPLAARTHLQAAPRMASREVRCCVLPGRLPSTRSFSPSVGGSFTVIRSTSSAQQRSTRRSSSWTAGMSIGPAASTSRSQRPSGS